MKSIRARITAINIALVAGVLVAMGLGLRAELHANLLREVDQGLSADVASVVTRKVTGSPTNLPDPPSAIRRGGGQAETRLSTRSERLVEVVRDQGAEARIEVSPQMPRLFPVPYESSSIGAIRPVDAAGVVAAERGGQIFRDFSLNSNPMRSLSEPVRVGGKVIAVAQAVRPLSGVRAQMAGLDRSLAMLIPVAVVVAAIAGAVLVSNTMIPLRRLLGSARRLEADLSGERLPAKGGDEFAELGRAFNDAFDRTAAVLEAQRRSIEQLETFTGDAGHELRTPLAAIKGAATYLLHIVHLPADTRKSVEIIDCSSDRMTKLIDDLLLLARQDAAGQVECGGTVNLAQIVDSALSTCSLPEGLTVENRVCLEMTVVGNPDGLTRLFSNLIANAVAYGRSSVVVAGDLQRNEITVTDDGDGIAPEDLARIGERFYRPDPSRSRSNGGTGLGLAIAKGIAKSHGAAVTLNSQVGHGTTVSVQFPPK